MKYRAEIDGLRALAVIPVILFHAGFELFSGGFIGVDIFFVISGYLITSIIIEDIEKEKFSLLKFYERRMRRILPALTIVTLTSTIFGWVFLNDAALNKFGDSVIGVSLFISNIVFWKQQGYFDESSEINPLLHTWSLAIEEQYYLFFPIFLIFAWRFGRNKVFWMIVLFALASLLFSEWGWRNKERANFYLAPTRAWEIFAGSISAFIVYRQGVRKNNILSISGLTAIVFAIFVYTEKTPFPSFYTLLPVAGVVLLILYADTETWVAKILSFKLIVGIGLISYSLYLWHQPIFAYFRIYSRDISIPTDISFLIMCITTSIAFISWKYIEKPFRAKSNFKKNSIIIMSISSLSILLLIGFVTKKVVEINGSEHLLAKHLSKNQYVYFQNMDERRFIEGRLIYPLKQVNHIVVGSSRLMQIDSETIGEPIINLSVSSALVEDLFAITPEAVAKLGSKNVYLSADPWVLSLNDGKNNRYKSISNLFNYWFEIASNKKELKAYLKWRNNVNSQKEAKGFLKYLRNKLLLEEFSLPIDNKPESFDKKAYDGLHIYNQEFYENKNNNYNIDWFNNAIGLFENVEYDLKSEKNFQLLVQYLKNLDVKVSLILTPYHPEIYSLMKSQKKVFLEIENRFKNFAEQNNIEIIGSYNPNTFGCNKNEFFDGMHPKPSCMRKIFYRP